MVLMLRCPARAQTHLAAPLAQLRVEHLSLRLVRCDSVGPFRLPAECSCALDEALARVAATTGGGTALILDEVRDLQEVIVEVGRREMRWTRGQVRR